MNTQEPEFELVPLQKEEGELIVAKLAEFQKEHSIDFVVTPLINQNGTIGAKVELFKKVAKIVSPIQSDEIANTDTKTEESGASDSGESA